MERTPIETLRAEVMNRFGLLPNFFRLAQDPQIMGNLWSFARFAYLDNPLPSLFKERLFVYLSRFCEVRYCIVRHVGFLLGLGRPAGDAACAVHSIDEVLTLIRRPLPRGKGLQPALAQCEACDPPLVKMPGPDCSMEQALFACATHVFLQSPDAPRSLNALRRALGQPQLQYLTVFLCFVRTGHYWTKIHDHLHLEQDIERLLQAHETLADCLLNDPEAGNGLVSAYELRNAEKQFRDMIDALPTAIYTTDAKGRLTHYNPACVEFSGRTPELGNDRWSVSWKLYYPDGRPMPHEECPMATALRQRRVVRGEEVIAERPDGERIWFEPYPTPLFDEAGELTGGINMLLDVTDRKLAAARLEADLADFTRIQRFSGEMVHESDPQALYEKIIDAAVDIMRSDFASMQMLYPERGETGELKLLAHRGFDSKAAAHWEWVRTDSKCSCGTALVRRQRCIEPDVANSALLAGTADQATYLQTGIRSVQSTPLISRGGALLGMISTHWRKPHQPSERELRNFDVLARQAADIIERARAEKALLQSQARLAGQTEALQAAISGEPLESSLNILIRTAVEQFGNGTRAAFYMANPAGTALHHVVGMSKPYAKCVDGFKIGPNSLACGLAVYSGEPVLTADVEDEPKWQPWLWLAREHDYRGCWSFPVQTAAGKMVGTLAVYHSEPRKLIPGDHALAEALTRAAGVIIARHQASEERDRAEESLREADRRKDEFLAIMAHELRNPLAAIRNATQILMRPDGEARSAAAATKILDRQVRHMVRQVDDLLDVSRISRGKIELGKEQTELARIVNHAAEDVRPLCESLGHELIVTLPPHPVYLHGDPIRLAQVMSNLLNNACKFTDRGGRIELTLEQEGGQAVVRVRDTGVGLAAAELRRIFETFAQADRSLERARDGLGLGLALAKELVEMHGGTVEARSAGLGQGSEFEVRLPALAGPRPALPRGPSDTQPATTARRRILVVDDNRDVADSLALLLKFMGHEVDTAHDGLEAVERAATFRADVILLDIGMPHLNGYEAARCIRERQGRHGLRLVALTGWNQEEDRRRSEEAGFDAHLVKPVDLAALTKMLAECSAG